MDAAAFEQVYQDFQEFHAYSAPLFGRRETREHSRHYLQALPVQAGERRNAENLSESVGISARAMQRFLTEARWSDDAVIGRLQEYLAPRLGHSEAVWVLDGAFLLSLQPAWGKKMARITRPQCTGWCGKCCPGNGSGPLNCCGGWRRRKNATRVPAAPMRSAAPPFVHPQASLPELSL